MSEALTLSEPAATREIAFAPLSALSDAGDVYDVFRDVLRGHHKLYEDTGYLHRDVSFSNILCKREERVIGALVDLDLACDFPTQSEILPSKLRTSATRAFIALDLIHPSRRHKSRTYYRHDLESLFYVLFWFIHRYHNGTLVDKPPLDNWNVSLASAQHRNKEETDFGLEPTSRFKSLYPLQREITRAYDAGYFAHRDNLSHMYETARELHIPMRSIPQDPFPSSTLNGCFTFEVVEKLFDQHRPNVS